MNGGDVWRVHHPQGDCHAMVWHALRHPHRAPKQKPMSNQCGYWGKPEWGQRKKKKKELVAAFSESKHVHFQLIWSPFWSIMSSESCKTIKQIQIMETNHDEFIILRARVVWWSRCWSRNWESWLRHGSQMGNIGPGPSLSPSHHIRLLWGKSEAGAFCMPPELYKIKMAHKYNNIDKPSDFCDWCSGADYKKGPTFEKRETMDSECQTAVFKSSTDISLRILCMSLMLW